MHQGISRQYYERARPSLLTAPFLMQGLENQCYQSFQNENGLVKHESPKYSQNLFL